MLDICKEIEFYIKFTFSNQIKNRYNTNLLEYLSKILFIKNSTYNYSFSLFFQLRVSQYIKLIFYFIFYKIVKFQHFYLEFLMKLAFYADLRCRYLSILYSFLYDCMIIQQWISRSFCDMTTINRKVIIYN